MIHPWKKERTELVRYKPSVKSRIFPIREKSMPPVPAILRISPSESAVVALPIILGPSTEKTVEQAASIITIKIAILYLPM